jgi:hypothetical protein
MQLGTGAGARVLRTQSCGRAVPTRRRVLRRWLIIAGAAGLAAFALTSLLAGAAEASAPSQLHLVPGDVPQLDLATLLHPAAATMKMEIGVGVSRPDTAGELKLYSQMYDKTSPLYHQFLTVAQFNARFGVSPATTDAVRDYLANAGLAIATSSGGDYFIATGTVAQMEKLFKVTIGDYAYKTTTFYANDRAPSVPTSLPIDAIAGLDSVHAMSLADLKGHTLAHATARTAVAVGRRVLAHAAIKPSVASLARKSGDTSVTAQAGDEQVYTPQDLWGIYDDPGTASLVSSTGTTTASAVGTSTAAFGQGQTMGIFTDGETSSAISQLRLFEAAEGLPKIPVRTYETEGSTDSDYGDNTGSVEWYLDSQASTGMSPDAKQLDFFTSKSIDDADIAASFSYWANDQNGPKEMNASFGECEANPTNPVTGPLSQLPYGTELGDELEVMAEPILRQATMEGRTLFSSAGDTGSGCPEVVLPVVGAANGIVNQPVPIVSYPCASDYDVCVGGTVVSSPGTTYPDSAKRSAETSWTNGGGGTSYFIPAQSFQDAVAHIDHRCLSTPDGSTIYALSGTTAPTCRGVPDVADLSGNTEGDAYFIYIDDAPSSEGGTSLSSPLMMGQWTRIQSAAPANVQTSGGLGYADPVIYAQAASADTCTVAPCTGTYARDFNDVTASEDVGDLAGSQGAGSLTGINGIDTGIGTGNGEYNDSPGWDYASGWGSLNVANFMQDVDKTTTATDAYTGTEQPAVSVCTATMASPAGNATDPVEVQLGNIPAADITASSLAASASTVTATFTVPGLSDGPAPYGTDIDFTAAWLYDGTVYTATADDAVGKVTYSDSAKPSEATGSSTATTVTITVPTSDVGSPPAGALLQDPQAYSAIIAAVLPFTADSSDSLRLDSVDDGQLDSIGEDVVVGGVSGANCSNTLPVTNLTTANANPAPSTTPTPTPPTKTTMSGTGTSATQVACEKTSKLPVTHITHKALSKTKFALSGTAAAHCPDRITKVGLSIAKVIVGHVRHRYVYRCEFLTARHRWTRAGSCAPRDYFTAKGLGRWSFSVKRRFTKGTYRIWEHATDNKRYTTRNVASKYVFLRLK